MKRQAEHHRNLSFEEEFLAFLKKHAIDYDPKYVWGYEGAVHFTHPLREAIACTPLPASKLAGCYRRSLRDQDLGANY